MFNVKVQQNQNFNDLFDEWTLYERKSKGFTQVELNKMSIEFQVDLLHDMMMRGKYSEFEMHLKHILKSIKDLWKKDSKD